MPGPYVPNLVRVTVKWSHPLHGFSSNVFHVDRGAGSAQAAAQAFADTFVAWWNGTGTFAMTPLFQQIEQSTKIVGFAWQDLGAPGGNVGDLPGPATQGGANDNLPPDLAVVISWRTGIGGPSKRGRSYLGNLGLQVLNPATGFITASRALAIKQGADTFITELAAAGPLLVVYSRVGVGGMATITNARVDTHFDVQRRRGD